MKKTSLMLFALLLGAALFGEATPRQVSAQPEIPTGKLVNAIRLLNTLEVSYTHENERYADRRPNVGLFTTERPFERITD